MFLASSKNEANNLPATASVAYFCAEYGLNDTLPIYSGGLGILAGDIVQEASQLNFPLLSVGLFYKKGFFHQLIDENGQKELPQPIDPLRVPLELLKDAQGETLLIEVPIGERTVFAQIWRYPVGANSLYLLDTDHWRNAPADREITDQLYGGDQSKRIEQELVLGVGGLRALRRLGFNLSLFHMNEGHSAFLALELWREYLQADPRVPVSTEDNLEKVRRRLVFTNHTIVPAGNDIFSHDLVRTYLGKYAFDSGIGIDKILDLGHIPEKTGFFGMTRLALNLAGRTNAVSQVHAKKAAALWPGFNFKAITNGIHLPAWVAPELQHLWDQHLPAWRSASAEPASWKALRRLNPATLWEAHQFLKAQMLDEVYARTGIRLENEVLTVVWARRFATYKRPDLLFSDLEKLKALLFSAEKPIQIIVSGKSHPADISGKRIIEEIDHLANYQLGHRAVFVNDYSISLAKFLVSGADIWLNTPIYGFEASGTSGMKAAANGVLQCTVPDGWAAEVDWYGLGFSLPIKKTETEIYSLFSKRILPLYYRRSAENIPDSWIGMMKESIITLSPRFCSQRLLKQYIQQLYLPALASTV